MCVCGGGGAAGRGLATRGGATSSRETTLHPPTPSHQSPALLTILLSRAVPPTMRSRSPTGPSTATTVYVLSRGNSDPSPGSGHVTAAIAVALHVLAVRSYCKRRNARRESTVGGVKSARSRRQKVSRHSTYLEGRRGGPAPHVQRDNHELRRPDVARHELVLGATVCAEQSGGERRRCTAVSFISGGVSMRTVGDAV